jgi:protein tyrosine phosphatase (PTP) superfamily phosphohydrolase (DUF442 family)
MGDTDRAQAHVQSLFEFAKKTPFETGPIIEASRMMQTFGGDALNTKENLELLGDASAATGAPINELGFWVGRLNSMLQGGQAFGEAAMRLQELAVLSPKARDEMKRLQEAGADADAVFNVFREDLKKFGGGMIRQAQTWEGVTSTFIDTVQLTLADAFKPLFEFMRDGLATINELLNAPELQVVPEKIKEALIGAFGGNTKEAVLVMTKTLLGFGISSLELSKSVAKGFNFIRLVFHGVAIVGLSVAEVLNLVALGFAHIINVTPGMKGSMDGAISTMTGMIDTLDDMNDSQMEQFAQTGKNLSAQNAWDDAMDNGIGMLRDMEGVIDNVTLAAGDEETAIKNVTNEVDAATEAFNSLNEKQKELVTGWQRGAIPAAEDMMVALDHVGGLTRLTADEKRELNGVLEDALAKYRVMGEEAPQAMREIAAATREVLESSPIDGINPWVSLYTMPGGFMASIDQGAENVRNAMIRKGGLPALGLEIEGGISEVPDMPSFGAMLGSGLKRGFKGVLDTLPDTVIGAFKGGGGLMGAFQALGTQLGSVTGGNIGAAWGASVAGKEGVGKLMKGFANLAGPIGSAIGALAGPLIGGLKKLFGGPTTQESVTKASERMFGKAISSGLADAIANTRNETESDFGAMMVHMADIISEQGGVIAMGTEKAIRSVRDIFSAVETGAITTEQAATSFDKSFGMIADAVVESGGIATEGFTELITLAERFGTTAETLKFVGEQSQLAATGLAQLFGPTIEDAKGFKTAIEEDEAALVKLNETEQKLNQTHEAQVIAYEKLAERKKNGTVNSLEFDRAENRLMETMRATEELHHKRASIEERLISNREKLNELSGKSKEELEDLGTIAVASFESALAAGMSFTDAVKAHGPALDAISEAQKELGIESENVAVQELAAFQERIKNNSTLVTAVEALDGTMLALSRTGSLNAETLGAMERQGIRMYDKLIEKGFSQEQAVLMMGPALKTIMEAHEKLGIPVDENTQKLIDQAKEAGHLEDEQKSGWAAVTTAVETLVTKMDTLITRLMGVKDKVNEIPRNINISARVNYTTGEMGDHGDAGTGLDFSAQHGGIITRPSIGLVGEAGPEAIIPLTQIEQRDRALLAEVRGLKSELRNLPIHLRDAILLTQ